MKNFYVFRCGGWFFYFPCLLFEICTQVDTSTQTHTENDEISA